ncbi:hypothetical protein PoB_005421500 [Plakobranchus ocellatus]|uniref:Uncharacterized protein n=1 Tax=Plakobranchus ocellatus TaxID=259542 RepID=A0AAV4C7Q3_9GAST|nr:hypothetical protein PoB_005421500 [Plakobranchus ocellatus]
MSLLATTDGRTNGKIDGLVWFLCIASLQQGDLRLSGNRRVPADLRADSRGKIGKARRRCNGPEGLCLHCEEKNKKTATCHPPEHKYYQVILQAKFPDDKLSHDNQQLFILAAARELILQQVQRIAHVKTPNLPIKQNIDTVLKSLLPTLPQAASTSTP